MRESELKNTIPIEIGLCLQKDIFIKEVEIDQQ